jgi:hypothetical protein
LGKVLEIEPGNSDALRVRPALRDPCARHHISAHVSTYFQKCFFTFVRKCFCTSFVFRKGSGSLRGARRRRKRRAGRLTVRGARTGGGQELARLKKEEQRAKDKARRAWGGMFEAGAPAMDRGEAGPSTDECGPQLGGARLRAAGDGGAGAGAGAGAGGVEVAGGRIKSVRKFTVRRRPPPRARPRAAADLAARRSSREAARRGGLQVGPPDVAPRVRIAGMVGGGGGSDGEAGTDE